jgi:hypothetical protein
MLVRASAIHILICGELLSKDEVERGCVGFYAPQGKSDLMVVLFKK